jgi:hypothetical protein
MSNQKTSRDSPSATSLQASEDGRSPSSWQGGLQMPLFGLDLVPVSHSASQAKVKEQQTRDTSGLSSSASLRSAILQSSLENRLRASLDVDGSPEYVLTWKHWAMESGLPICALRSSGRPTEEAGFGGWPSPAWHDGRRPAPDLLSTQGTNLSRDVVLWTAGWPTPSSTNVGDGTPYEVQNQHMQDRRTRTKKAMAAGEVLAGSGRSMGLQMAAQAAGWPTPMANDAEKRGNVAPSQRMGLPGQAQSAGWMTPTVNDATGSQYAYSSGDHDKVVLKLPGQAQAAGWTTPTKDDVASRKKPYAQGGYPLSYQAQAAGWGTPTSRDHKDSTGQTLPTNGLLGRQALDSGMTQSSSPASTASRGVLNSELARWLMGFPAEWGSYAPTATPSSRKSRRSS